MRAGFRQSRNRFSIRVFAKPRILEVRVSNPAFQDTVFFKLVSPNSDDFDLTRYDSIPHNERSRISQLATSILHGLRQDREIPQKG